MIKDVLYLGDTELNQAGSYLAGIMTFFDISYNYVASDKKFSASFLDAGYRLYIISDYPAANFSSEQLLQLAECLHSGSTSLWMIGGWDSFVGSGGGYHKTTLAEVLPVQMGSVDDRLNYSGPFIVEKVASHPVVDGLPFDKNAPAIGGLNRLTAKSNAQVLLRARCYKATKEQDEFSFTAGESFVLLATGSYGSGKTIALATDVAPHWVGPMLDWGQQRIVACGQGAEEIEVGRDYAEFIVRIITWLLKK